MLLSFSAIAQTNPAGCIIVSPYGTVPAFPNIYTALTGFSVPATENANIQGLPVYDGFGASVAVSYSCYSAPPPTARQCVVRGSSTQWYGGCLLKTFISAP